MATNNLNIDKRIKFLLYKIKKSKATKKEQKEYIDLLYEGAYINTSEYNRHLSDFNKENSSLGEALVGIGIAVLVGALIAELFKK